MLIKIIISFNAFENDYHFVTIALQMILLNSFFFIKKMSFVKESKNNDSENVIILNDSDNRHDSANLNTRDLTDVSDSVTLERLSFKKLENVII